MTTFLTDTIISLTEEKIKQENSFGISIVNLPDIDYQRFAYSLGDNKDIEIFFLGYPNILEKEISEWSLPGNVSICFTVEEAEKSRNLGREDIFRIHFIKNTELEKVSSLRWYEEISIEQVYKYCCKIALSSIGQKNETIKSLIRALRRKEIRSILNFERVIDYLDSLLKTNETELPFALSKEIHRLGLLSDPNFASAASTQEQIMESIKRNYSLVRRITSLEQKERQNIANYLSLNPDKEVVRLILDFYRTHNTDILEKLFIEDVDTCLKTVAMQRPRVTSSKKSGGSSATQATSQLIFEGKEELIDQFIEKAKEIIDARPDNDKSEIKSIEVEGISIEVPVQQTTERLASDSVSDMRWGGQIIADVSNPKEALENTKYELEHYDDEYIEKIREYIKRAASFQEVEIESNAILKAFDDFIECRKSIVPFATRLQDMPMLQVVSKIKLFSNYLEAYERLLSELKNGFKALYDLDDSGAKKVIGSLMCLDIVFVIGKSDSHAIPTPLNPLYLWKYIKLAEEELGSRGISEEDKSFIIRKAEDIPDPLTLVMLPHNDITGTECLPYAGRLGCLPVYSTKPQISDSDAGIEDVCQGITRYMCLYPHSSMMLRICFINPPTVDSVVSMLKRLDKDKEFSAFGDVGVDLSIYRTKETSSDWVNLDDKALNEGLLGRVRGTRSGLFNLTIKDKCLSYNEVIKLITKEQHIIVVFDPNEKEISTARNSRNIHIHPLCVPKVYEYKKMSGEVKIRAANEGGIFADYASIIEKLYEQPSTFGHRNVFMNSPIKKETFENLLSKADWLIILDQNLKSWDISLRSTSERLFYKNTDTRSIGIYSKNSQKFILGYKEIISSLGNYIPNSSGINNVIDATREINDDGLLSIVSHSTNRIFDQNHGKGSLGLAIAAMRYKKNNPDSILVGLDTQLARAWLSDRDDGRLPDLVGIRFESSTPIIDLIEVKTYNAYTINGGVISGPAVEQASILEDLITEIFGNSEKITTVARREILREQVFECLFNNGEMDTSKKQSLSDNLNSLFAGEYSIVINRNIHHVSFDSTKSLRSVMKGSNDKDYYLSVIGSLEIQALLSDSEYSQVTVSIDNTYPNPNSEIAEIKPEEESNVLQEEQTSVKDNPASIVKNDTPDNDVDMDDSVAQEIHEKCIRLNVVLKSYGLQVLPIDETLVQKAARFTRFKLELKPGETEANLKRRSEDIARELEASGEVFVSRPKGTRYIAFDIPFKSMEKPLRLLDNLYRLKDREGSLNFLAGQSPDGQYQIVDLATAPHMLVAGTTGSGKTSFLNAVIISLLEQFSPDELELLIVDPKQMDFHFYEGLPYLREGKVLVDPNEAIEALKHIQKVDMPERRERIKSAGCNTITTYNAKNPSNKMKFLVVIIDEYSALVNAADMQGKKIRDDFEKNICTLVYMARSFGIQIIIATQYPTANYVTSSLKANLPFRVAFRLPSHTDSMTILDKTGAEDLLGKGDMLMQTESDTLRLQGFYINEDELVDYFKKKQ